MAGFHEGELAVQEHAGVRAEAARLATMVAPGQLSGGASRFLAEREFAVLTARDADGRLWTSPLFGPAGFLDGAGAELLVHAAPGGDDPLSGLAAGQPIGLLAIEFATRRRMRVNGTLTSTGSDGLTVVVDQAYGNCPQYIHPRRVSQHAGSALTTTRIEQGLTDSERLLITAADTFFLGTLHPTRGADASHRGGPAGFVRLDGDELWWPDYPGNNMFNSFGNLAVDPSAALLFLDFETGARLYLSGTAVVEWDSSAAEGADSFLDTGRRVRFTPQALRLAGPTTER